jgi:hypothetical protein
MVAKILLAPGRERRKDEEERVGGVAPAILLTRVVIVLSVFGA